MKFLHTADLHLGRFLDNRPRWPEQQAILDEIAALVETERVDLALLAGDIFDAFIPPAAAEQMFYLFAERLAAAGCAVVAIAGNHDQPQRLAAAQALAAHRGIFLIGMPGTRFPATTAADGIGCLPSRNALRLRLANGEQAVVAALPYLSEARLQELYTEDITDEVGARHDYQRVLLEKMEQLAADFRPDTANFVLAHLFVAGGHSSDSERPLSMQVGGSFGVSRDVFPAGADYIALGHLHRAQQVRHAVPCFYAGSPLAYSFSECDQVKAVMLGEIAWDEAGKKRITLQAIPLQAGRPLAIWRVGSYAEALQRCSDPALQDVWVSLQIELEQPLTAEQLDALQAAHPCLVAVTPLYREQGEVAEYAPMEEKSIPQRFADFVLESEGVAADDALLDAFCQLLAEEEEEEEE